MIICVPGLLIAKQPDLGTAIQVISTGFGVLFFAGFPGGGFLKYHALAHCRSSVAVVEAT